MESCNFCLLTRKSHFGNGEAKGIPRDEAARNDRLAEERRCRIELRSNGQPLRLRSGQARAAVPT